MTFRIENQDNTEIGYENYEQPYEDYNEYPMMNYGEYPMMNYYPMMYEPQMTPYYNMPYQGPEYTEYDEDIMAPRNDGVSDDKESFRQYHHPYYHHPYYYHPYYHHPYYYPPYYPYFDYGYGYEFPFLAGLALGSFF